MARRISEMGINAQGGRIYIGIDDTGKVIGIQNGKRLLEEIPNKIQTNLGFLADVNLLSKNGLEYIEVIVNPSSYLVQCCKINGE